MEQVHGKRRCWVWADLDMAPLAVALMQRHSSGRGEDHFMDVTRHSMMLHDVLKPPHQLDSRFRVVLWAAVMLHDIGADPKLGRIPTSHAWRSADKILQDQVGDEDIPPLEIAIVASLHRHEGPDEEDILGMTYQSLDHFITPELLKLAAILRVADGLDRYEEGRMTKFTLIGDAILVQGSGHGFANNFEHGVRKSGLLKRELGLELCRKSG